MLIKILRPVVIGLTITAPLNVWSQKPDKAVDRQEILALIPKGVDPGNDDGKGMQKLIDMGAAAYPVLCEELLSADDYIAASRLLSPMIQSHGDKTLPRETIKKLIAKSSGASRQNEDMLIVSVQALKEIGNKEDTTVLLPLLNSTSKVVRFNVLQGLAKIGDEQAAKQIQAWLETQKSSMSEAEQTRDPSIREAEKAPTAIRDRLKNDAGQ